MKKMILICMGLLTAAMPFAQTPAAFKYQAVARDASGAVLANKILSFRISILEGSSSGTAVFREIHSTTSNEFGLVNLEIGNGSNLNGNIAGIDWGGTTHFLKIEMDPNGGAPFIQMGTSQLLSVPYALHAKTAETGDNWGGQYALTDATISGNGTAASPLKLAQQGAINGQALKWNGSTWLAATDEVDDADNNASNEIQLLQLNGNQLSLTLGGGTVTLPTGQGDNWGTQLVAHDATLTGNGTTASPLILADNAVTSAKITNSAVTAEKLTANAVITEKINAGAVTGVKIAQEGAAIGQALKWNGTTWAPGNDLMGSSGLWQQNGSKIFYNDGLVGIGTNDPQYDLHLHAKDVFSGIQFTNEASGRTINDGFVIGQQYQDETVNHYGMIKNKENTSLYITTNNLYTQLTLNPDGNVGIGSIEADAKLHVAGQVKITGGNPGNGKVLTSDASGLATWQSPSGGMALPYFGVVSSATPGFRVNNNGSGYGIIGSAEGTAGQNCGVAGQSQSPNGMGVYGVVIPTGGVNYGVYGLSNSDEGRGVVGVAGSTTGLNFGVRGVSSSSSGIGVDGQGSSSTGLNFGVRGSVSSAEGFSGAFFGGRFFVENKVGIGNQNPDYKLDVTGDRIRLSDGGEWIAMRTDGSPGLLDLSFSGGGLVIQGNSPNENIIINPAMNKVGIRTWTPQYELDVNGSIRVMQSVYYGGSTGAADGTAYIKPDYVFEEDYDRLNTGDVEEFLAREKHLPWVTSAKQEKIENQQTTDMTRMAFETLESVENVQLQVISQGKTIKELKTENNRLKTENRLKQSKIEEIELRLSRLEYLMGVNR